VGTKEELPGSSGVSVWSGFTGFFPNLAVSKESFPPFGDSVGSFLEKDLVGENKA